MVRKKKNGVTQSETMLELLENHKGYDDFYPSDGDQEIGFSIPKKNDDSDVDMYWLRIKNYFEI